MGMTIEKKIAVGVGALLVVLIVIGLMSYAKVQDIFESITAVTDQAEPISAAAYEMEINVIGTGFAVLGYVHDSDRRHLERIADDAQDFENFQRKYHDLVTTSEGKALGAKVDAGYARLRKLAGNLIRLHDSQTQAMQSFSNGLVQIDDLLDEQIQPEIKADQRDAYQKLEAALEMEINTNGIAKHLGNYLYTHDDGYEQLVDKDVEDFQRYMSAYRAQALLSQKERQASQRASALFEKAAALAKEVIALDRSKDGHIAQLVQLRRELEGLLDEEIQHIAHRDLSAAKDRARATIAETARFLAVALGIGLVVGGLAVTFTARSIAKPIGQLATATDAIARGDLSQRVKITSGDEVGVLAGAFNRMAEYLEKTVGFEERHREVTELSNLGELLHACSTSAEAYTVIGRSAPRLFPNEAGGVCLVDDSGSVIETVAKWGENLSLEDAFTPRDCWALRRGRIHSVSESHPGPTCGHLSSPVPSAYLCVPMMAQGGALGVLHLQTTGEAGGPEKSKQDATRERLAKAAADSIGLALANLRLRDLLYHQSVRDPLTGLFNRRYMEESLQREVSRAARNQLPLAVIVMDLDRFKQVNDSFGHEAGDTLLRELGARLQKNIRHEDIACRHGGEEFILILPGVPLDMAQKRSAQMLQQVRDLDVQHQGQTLGPITCSIGVAVFPLHGQTVTELLNVADAALYCAKSEGRDRIAIGQLRSDNATA